MISGNAHNGECFHWAILRQIWCLPIQFVVLSDLRYFPWSPVLLIGPHYSSFSPMNLLHLIYQPSRGERMRCRACVGRIASLPLSLFYTLSLRSARVSSCSLLSRRRIPIPSLYQLDFVRTFVAWLFLVNPEHLEQLENNGNRGDEWLRKWVKRGEENMHNYVCVYILTGSAYLWKEGR